MLKKLKLLPLNLEEKYVGVIKLKFGRPISFATFASHLNYSSLVWTQNSGFIKSLIIHQKRPLE